jgi:hypothetical protein
MRRSPQMAATNLSQNPVPVPQNPSSLIPDPESLIPIPSPESLIGAGARRSVRRMAEARNRSPRSLPPRTSGLLARSAQHEGAAHFDSAAVAMTAQREAAEPSSAANPSPTPDCCPICAASTAPAADRCRGTSLAVSVCPHTAAERRSSRGADQRVVLTLGGSISALAHILSKAVFT